MRQTQNQHREFAAVTARGSPNPKATTPCAIAFALLSFVLAGVAQIPSPNAKLFMKSGFEAETSLESVSGRAHNQWPRFHGTDRSTGMSWDENPFGGTPYTLLQGITANNAIPAPGDATDYIQNTIETVTGPYGSLTKALKMHILKPSPNTCCIQDAFEVWRIAVPIKDIYVAHWMKFNPEMLNQMQAQGSSYWRMLFEMKTATDYRIQANIHWDGKPYLHVHADNRGLSDRPNLVWYWQVDNKNVPVPLDQWFYTEYYLHRAADDTGRFFWGINGQTIVDRSGPTYGVRGDEISALMFTNLYGPNPVDWYQWVDDFQVWDLPPCTDLPCGAPRGATRAATAGCSFSRALLISPGFRE